HAHNRPALAQAELRDVGAAEARATREQRPQRGRPAGSTGLRPIESYSKPKRRIRSGSQRFRPSKTTGRRMTARSRSRLRNLNSFHSVMRATASASAAAAYGEAQ